MEFLAPEIKAYAEAHTSPESDLLSELNRETHVKVLYPQMLSGHLQGRVLAMLSKLLAPNRILEVGTYTGYSALCLAEGLRDDGKLYTIEIDPELNAMARAYCKEAGMESKIEFLIGSALDLIPKIEDEIDLAFIDADKGNYVNYYELIIPKLRQGGIILADNVLWSGKVLGGETTKDKETNGLVRFNKHVTQDPRVEQVLLPIRDGIMVIRKL